eukprot:7170536-Prymnesium_polylepis.1
MKQVPAVAIATWENLLLSEVCSDVTFVCGDGESLPAHTCVLASASAYFKQLFTGPWRASQTDGEGQLQTSNESAVMRGLLSFIYTGALSTEIADGNTAALYSLSKEYLLPELQRLMEAKLAKSIGPENLRELLLLAHLHQATALKAKCHAFVQLNKVTVLTQPSMLSLAAEKPEVWKELVETVGANEPAAKRPRVS